MAGNGICHPNYKVSSLRFFIEFDNLMIQIYDIDTDYLDEAVNPQIAKKRKIRRKEFALWASTREVHRTDI